MRTRRHLTSLGFGVLCVVTAGCSFANHAGQTEAGQSAVSYSPAKDEWLRQMHLSRITLSDTQLTRLKVLPQIASDHGTRWCAVERPDTLKPGPWTTKVYIFDHAVTSSCICLEVRDHASYDVRTKWVNEKLLFVSAWWGRVAGTDCIIDLQSCKLAYAEDVSYLGLVKQPEEPVKPSFSAK